MTNFAGFFLLLFSFSSHATVLVTQPTQVINPSSITYVNQVPTKGTMGVILWGSNYSLVPTGDLTLANYTGFLPPVPVSNYQISVAPKWPGATAVQAKGGEIGINIHSASIPANLAQRYNLGTIVIHYDFPKGVQAFANSTNRLIYSFRLEVPRAYQYGKGVSQVVAYLNFRDKIHKQSLWFGMVVFDSRGIGWQLSNGGEYALWDQGTGLPIVHTTAGYSIALADKTVFTNGFMGTTYTGLRRYAFALTGVQFKAAIRMLKAKYPQLATRLSDQPEDYELNHLNLNPEIYSPPGSFAHIGLSVKELKLELL